MISGANRDIGKAIAMRLHQEGYSLSLGVREPESVDLNSFETTTTKPFVYP